MIRKAKLEDFDAIMHVIDISIQKMRSENNMEQWSNREAINALILKDIESECYYVVKTSDIVGCFSYTSYDKNYDFIEGKWLNDASYGVIHRIGSDFSYKNMLNDVLKFCFEKTDNIKVDTHKDNIRMQQALLRHGFSECGVIYLEDGSMRLAYQKEKSNV